MATCIIFKKNHILYQFPYKDRYYVMYIIEIILKKKYVTFKYINVYCSLFWLEYHAMFGRLGQFVKVPSIHYIY